MLNTVVDRPALATDAEAQPLLLGTLSIETHWKRGPRLFLTVVCCHCRKPHHHAWGVEDADRPHPRQPHCGPYRTGLLPEYRIFPSESPHNAAVLDRYRAALAEWEGRADATI